MASSWRSVEYNEYDPLKAGSIDGTDTRPHDRAVCRALCTKHSPPVDIKTKPECCVFLARLPQDIHEDEIQKKLEQVAAVRNVTVVRDVVTGMGKGYAFAELVRERDVERVLHECVGLTFGGKEALLDREVGRTMKGWVPRRLGGGWGGRKEAGQLRFGCRDRPWKCPLAQELSLKRNIAQDQKERSYGDSSSQSWDSFNRTRKGDFESNIGHNPKSQDSSRRLSRDDMKNTDSSRLKQDSSRRYHREDNDHCGSHKQDSSRRYHREDNDNSGSHKQDSSRRYHREDNDNFGSHKQDSSRKRYRDDGDNSSKKRR